MPFVSESSHLIGGADNQQVSAARRCCVAAASWPHDAGMTERRITPLRLTEESRAGWDRACSRHRVTMTALAEALGLALADDVELLPAEVVERAAAIDRQRRSR